MSARKNRDDDCRERARSAFEKHEIVEEAGPGHWVIRRKDSWCFSMRIVAAYPHIMMAGDGPTAVLRGGDSNMKPLDMIRWIAGSCDSYVHEKLRLGMEARDPDQSHDFDVMVEDLRDHLAEDEKWGGRYREVYEDAIEAAINGDAYGVRQILADGIEDGWEIDPGWVTPSTVFYAREACRTLLRLLGEPLS